MGGGWWGGAAWRLAFGVVNAFTTLQAAIHPTSSDDGTTSGPPHQAMNGFAMTANPRAATTPNSVPTRRLRRNVRLTQSMSPRAIASV